MRILLLFIIASAACFAGPFDALTPEQLDARASAYVERWLRESGAGALGRDYVQRTRATALWEARKRLVGTEIMKAYARTYCRPGEERVYAREIQAMEERRSMDWFWDGLARTGDLTELACFLSRTFAAALEREAAYR